MDLIEHVRILARVAEQASFTRAAEQLGMPKSRVSLHVKALERELGTRLLQRTTRAVRPTPDGERFLERAKSLLDDAEELTTMFQPASALEGRVRLDLPVSLARERIIPALPDFLAQHPKLELVLSATDRRVELVKEGFDCVLRVGQVRESGLTAKRLGLLSMANCASPAYLRRFGVPRSIEDLASHRLVHYSLTLGGDEPAFEYRKSGRWVTVPMTAALTVNSVEAFYAACMAGLGIIQVPRLGTRRAVQEGSFVEVLPEHVCAPMPISLVHRHGRNVPKRVRAVMEWLSALLLPVLG